MEYTIFPDSSKNHIDAQKYCETNGKTLASFVNQDDINKILAKLPDPAHEYWTGLKYTRSYGNWSFYDNANTDFAIRKLSLSSNFNNDQCITVKGQDHGTFEIKHCTEGRKVLCQTGQHSLPRIKSGQKCKILVSSCNYFI